MRSIRFRLPSVALGVLLAVAASAQVVQLKVGSFDPAVRALDVPSDLRVAAPVGTPGAFHLVQFRAPLGARDWTWLRGLGLLEFGYVPDYTYVFNLSRHQYAALSMDARVRWIGHFEPAYKLSPELGRIAYRDLVRRMESAVGLRRMVVGTFPGRGPDEAVAVARRAGAEVLGVEPSGVEWRVFLRADLEQAKRVAHAQNVMFIEELPEVTLRNDVVSWCLQSNQTNVRPIWAQGIRGQGVIGGLMDGPMDRNHWSFADPNGNPIGNNHRKIQAYNGGSGADSHGTHTAGTMVGDLEPMNGQTTNSGMAPKARIVFSPISSGGFYNSTINQFNQGARVHSNSWGNDGTTSYDNLARDIDRVSYDREDTLVCFAVTNGSLLRNPENAKNVLAVGATSRPPNQGNVGTGGRGPTNDGRRKPEIFTPGVNTNSSRSGTQTGFIAMTGTSMACPAIAGASLLVRQYIQEGFLRNGRSEPAFGFAPSGALLRAMLMNSSVDMTGVSGYPTNNEGWGRLLLKNVLWFQGDTRRTVAWDVRNADGLTHGANIEYGFQVLGNTSPMRITMTFTDYPGDAFSNPCVVNNLDLEVIAPDGTVYKGNDINTSTGESRVGGNADTLNNTEMVLLANPQGGIWKVRVKATNIARGDRQGYAVVINGDVKGLPASVRPTP